MYFALGNFPQGPQRTEYGIALAVIEARIGGKAGRQLNPFEFCARTGQQCPFRIGESDALPAKASLPHPILALKEFDND